MAYVSHIMVICSIYVILTVSLNLLVGYTGLAAFGHGAFSCVGAYISAILALRYGVSPWVGMFVGGVSGVLLSLIVAIPAIRLSGDYLALATLGFALIVYSITRNWISVTRGPLGLAGIPRFSFIGWRLADSWSYVILVAIIAGITIFIISRIVDSPFGRVLSGIRQDEMATEVMGKHVAFYKIKVLMVGGFFSGVAGSLYAHYITFIDPSSFTIMESITILLMVVFGGMASLKGSFLGAVILIVFPELLRFFGLPSSVAAPLRQMIYGLLLVVLMLHRPKGLLGKTEFT